MLLKANYKQSYIPIKSGKGSLSVKVERGQFIFGRFKAEEELNIDGSMIYRQIKKFEDLEQIKILSNNQYSIITICNYDFYQSKNEVNGQPTNSQRTANEPDMKNERTANEHSIEELECIEGLEEKEYGKAKNFDFEEILNPSSFPTWRDECSIFLKDDYFKQQFCKDQKLPMGNVEELMRNFVKKLNLENDFKNVAGLKVHFVRHYNKHKNGKEFTAFTHSKGFIDVPENLDYDNMETW